MQARNRRVFMMQVIAGATTVAAAQVHAQTVSSEKVKETDAYPKSMGFRVDTATVDKAKYPRHDVSQSCSECQLYSGNPGDEWGPCSFFKRQVPSKGWCRNFKVRKAKA